MRGGRGVITRQWAMPSADTLSIKPIRNWVNEIIKQYQLVADPFARNCKIAQLTNDLNKETSATYHEMADVFLKRPEVQRSDVIIFDPPYTLRQVKECYDNYGTGFTHADSQNSQRWTIERDIIASFQKPGNGVISFGHTSTCMGKKRGYRIESILLCSHGPAHNDTICVFEIKQPEEKKDGEV